MRPAVTAPTPLRPPAARLFALGRVRPCLHAAAMAGSPPTVPFPSVPLPSMPLPSMHPPRSADDWPPKSTRMGSPRDGGIGTGLMGDRARNGPSRASTLVAPGVHTKTQNASILKAAVEWGERVPGRQGPHVPAGAPPAPHRRPASAPPAPRQRPTGAPPSHLPGSLLRDVVPGGSPGEGALRAHSRMAPLGPVLRKGRSHR